MKTLICHKSVRFGLRLIFLVPLIGGLLILAGCSKKPAPVAATPPPATATAPAAPATPTPSPTPVAPSTQSIYVPPTDPAPTVGTAANGGADLRNLNHIYFSWIARTHRRATTFEEFQAASGVQVPPAPEGKKYVIDHNGFINLASR